MCYVRKYQYRIDPVETYRVIRNCSGCGRKSLYHNTNNFRVNANGNKIDIWLIYQCEVCKHTFNLCIYERIRPDMIPKEVYEAFLRNDRDLSCQYGVDKAFFSKNRAEVDEKCLNYKVKASIERKDEEQDGFCKGDWIEIENPYGLKVRMDKIIADILGIPRTRVQKLQDLGRIEVGRLDLNRKFEVWIKEDLPV